MKLFVNMMLYGSMQVFSEVYALAEATGFPQDTLHKVFGTFLLFSMILSTDSQKLSFPRRL